MPFSFHAQPIRSDRNVYAVHAHEFTDRLQGCSAVFTFIKNITIVLYERILHQINSTLTWNKCLLCVTFSCVSPCKLDPIHNTHMCTYVCIRDRLEVVCCVYISRFFTYGLIRLRTPWRTICRTQSLSSISHAHENGHDYSVYRYTYREDPCVHQTKSNKEHLLLLFCCVVY